MNVNMDISTDDHSRKIDNGIKKPVLGK